MANYKPLDSVGRIKHQITRCDVDGNADASGAYIKLAQDYPLVQSADLTDTLVYDHTDDEPSNQIVAVADLSYNIGDQLFAKVDDGELARLLFYGRELTNEEVAKVLLFMSTGETLADADGELLYTSDGDTIVVPKDEYYSEIPWRYGIKIDKSDPDPDTRVEYLYDAVGATPAAMDYTAGTFDYGSWESFAKWVNKPVMLGSDGKVDYALDRDDHTKKTDGTASDVANTAYSGNAMSQFKKLYVKMTEDATHEYIIYSNVKYDTDYHAYAHTDKDGVEQDYMYRAMFEGSYDGSTLRSLATGSVMASQTGQTEITRAEANGSGWGIGYKSQRDFITGLLWLMSKSTNTQAKFGNGNSGSASYLAPGTLTSAGQFAGYNTTTQAVKVFYIENFWGNYWERLAGQLLDLSGELHVRLTPPYTQPALPDENVMPAGYTATGVTPSGGSGGYLTEVKVGENIGIVQDTTGGSATTYYCDGMWYSTATTIKWARAGGSRPYGALCGAAAVSLSLPLSSAYSPFGAALSFLENAS